MYRSDGRTIAAGKTELSDLNCHHLDVQLDCTMAFMTLCSRWHGMKTDEK